MEKNYKVAIALACTTVLAVVGLTFSIAHAETIDNLIKSVVHGPHISDHASPFKAESTKGTIAFPENYSGKWVIFFSFPSDFKPVSESEFKKIAGMEAEFAKLNTKLLALSPEPVRIHQRWIQDLEKKDDKKKASVDRITFPIIADEEMHIAQKYEMVHKNESPTETIRSVYIIDPKGIIRAVLHYPIANARNFDEIKRLLQALQATEKQKVATFADWNCSPAQTTPIERESRTLKAK